MTTLDQVRTLIENTAGVSRIYSFLPPHGKELAPGQQVEVSGHIYDFLKTSRRREAFERAIDNDELALALKTASDELKEKIFNNMSDRATQLIKEDMDYMGPVRLNDVEVAQQKIVDVVRRLEDAGEIIIQGRGGGESELVV